MSEIGKPQRAADFEKSREIVGRVVRQWSAANGSEVELDGTNVAYFLMKDEIGVAAQIPEDDSSLVLLSAPIAPLPDAYESRQFVVELMLEYNLAQQTMGGGAIGLDPDRGTLIFATAAMAAEFDTKRLDQLMETAIRTVLQVRELIGFDPKADIVPEDDDTEDDPELLLKV